MFFLGEVGGSAYFYEACACIVSETSGEYADKVVAVYLVFLAQFIYGVFNEILAAGYRVDEIRIYPVRQSKFPLYVRFVAFCKDRYMRPESRDVASRAS